MTRSEIRFQKSIEDRMRTCVHFNGVFVNESCKAGVVYSDLFGTGPGCYAHLLCTGDPEATTTCDKRETPTREQAEAEERSHHERAKLTVRCINAAHEHAKAAGLGRGHGGTGQMDCPAGCGGTLGYSVAGYNGHMHAKCITAGCVNWME